MPTALTRLTFNARTLGFKHRVVGARCRFEYVRAAGVRRALALIGRVRP